MKLGHACRKPAVLGAFAFASAANAEISNSAGNAATAPHPAAGLEIFASADSDDTSVVKLLGRTLVSDHGPDKYAGVAIEHASFTPLGQRTRNDRRFYLELADNLGRDWLWRARIGTDGKTWLGSASARSVDWSKEVFLEREIVETPRGVDKGIYYTFLGASLDLPASPRDTFTATAAMQEFTGDNLRIHVRGSYVHVVKPELGLSIQLRARAFHSTVPGEFDYFSPRNFVQVLPVVQMRRFMSSGWMVLAGAGYGLQKATNAHWQSARLADFRIESPRGSRDVRAFLNLQYSNSSLSGSGNYHYVMGRAGLTMKL